MIIVLLGKDGNLGSALLSKLSDNYEVIGFNKKELDITDSIKLKKELLHIRPNFIINAAAYTDVNNAEVFKEKALKINSEALSTIVESALMINSCLIHFSTDYVFDGTKNNSYIEDDRVNPLNFYGFSKRKGEELIINSKCKFLIFRLSTIIGGYNNNIIYKIINNACNNKKILMINDQYLTPTSVDFVSRNISSTIKKIINKDLSTRNIYHLSPNGFTTPYLLATKLFNLFNNITDKKHLHIKNINQLSHEEYFNEVRRPKNCILNSSKFFEDSGQIYPNWEYEYQEFAEKILTRFVQENLN